MKNSQHLPRLVGTNQKKCRFGRKEQTIHLTERDQHKTTKNNMQHAKNPNHTINTEGKPTWNQKHQAPQKETSYIASSNKRKHQCGPSNYTNGK